VRARVGPQGAGVPNMGNTRPGIVHGPAQVNWDIGTAKQFKMKWPMDAANFELRGDFFNAFQYSSVRRS
jgi:hypothetical protein